MDISLAINLVVQPFTDRLDDIDSFEARKYWQQVLYNYPQAAASIQQHLVSWVLLCFQQFYLLLLKPQLSCNSNNNTNNK